jgi:alkylhydroperoxidase family enzyme
VEAVLADVDSAPIGRGLRATLRFLRTMTLAPESLAPADAERVLAAGVSRAALRDAIEVSAGFNLITRLADAIGARPHSARGLTREQAIAHEGRFFDEGYA